MAMLRRGNRETLHLPLSKVTAQRIEEVILSEYYHVPPGTTMTICVLTLANGFTVSGESACVNQSEFDIQVGKDLAKRHAKSKIWALEGYLLHEQLAREKA